MQLYNKHDKKEDNQYAFNVISRTNRKLMSNVLTIIMKT